MASSLDRILSLAEEHLDLGRELNLDVKFSESGVSSMAALAFVRVLNEELGLSIAPADLDEFDTIRSLVAHIDSQLG